ncbi:hypothetical protein LY76DRAFT_195006 [Colletotrichum caudatum]|nr:hypothetical protein LY76DRAFT_195006 [Colletotrichum caudatum]
MLPFLGALPPTESATAAVCRFHARPLPLPRARLRNLSLPSVWLANEDGDRRFEDRRHLTAFIWHPVKQARKGEGGASSAVVHTRESGRAREREGHRGFASSLSGSSSAWSTELS